VRTGSILPSLPRSRLSFRSMRGCVRGWPLSSRAVSCMRCSCPGRVRRRRLQAGPWPRASRAWACVHARACPAWEACRAVSKATASAVASASRVRACTSTCRRCSSPGRLDFDRLRAEGGWSRRDGRLEVALDGAEFENGDAAGSASGRYWPAGRPGIGAGDEPGREVSAEAGAEAGRGRGEIDLQASLRRAEATAVWRYLPRVVNARTRAWGAARGARRDRARGAPAAAGQAGRFSFPRRPGTVPRQRAHGRRGARLCAGLAAHRGHRRGAPLRGPRHAHRRRARADLRCRARGCRGRDSPTSARARRR